MDEMIYMVINDEYQEITKNTIGVITLIYNILQNSDSTDRLLVKNPLKNPKWKIDDINKFYIKCINGNLVGSKLWIAYKFSEQNIDKLFENVFTWNHDMVVEVNKNCKPGYVQDPDIKISEDSPSDENTKYWIKLIK